jgi:uroporphyrinogen decarboxylase
MLAKYTLDFQQLFDFDFVKVSPSSSFCLKDWGAVDSWQGNPEGTREYQDAVVKTPEDWGKIHPLDPQKGNLGAQLQCLKLIRTNLDPTTPLIQTIFSPLAQIKNLVGKESFCSFLRKYPTELKKSLDIISGTTIHFIQECRRIPVDGIFYAVQQAQYGSLSESEFVDFGKFYDLKILSTLESYWLNIIHIHGNDIMFEQVKDYPVQIINWHDRDTYPSLSEARELSKKVFCGGLSRIKSMVIGDRTSIINECKNAINLTNGYRFILGTGCVLPITTPEINIRTAREFVDEI